MSPMPSMLTAVVVALAGSVAVTQAALFPPKTPVVQLTQSNFKKEVLSIEKPTMVMFSAPWCGHCKNLAPKYHKAAASLDGIVKFANIDCDEDRNKGLCAQYQVQGFPTLKLFPATKKRLPREYRGEREAKALIDYMKETLPAGARKIPPAELEKYVNENPTRPKVILFSDKPKSSPLFRSLALDFRKTMDFGFMRGDELLVRSSARLAIGVDIPTEKDLPVLIVVPGRPESEEGEEEATLEKGNFETYSGALKYWKIKSWLDEISSKVGADKSKAPKPPAPKKKPAKRAAPKIPEELIPEGGSVEWKANMLKEHEQGANMVKEAIERYEAAEAAAAEAPDAPVMDESKPQKESFAGQMLDIERAGQIADDIRKQQEAASRKRQGQYVGTKSAQKADKLPADEAVKEEAGSLLEKAKAAVSAAMDSAAQAVKEAGESIVESIDTAKVADSAKVAQQKVYDAASQAYGDALDLADLSGKPFEKKSKALMKQFEKWMSGERAGWEDDLGEQFEKAQVEAEELLKKDPEEAQRQAWASEEWLLKEMRQDRERMLNVMTPEQRSQVEGMIDLIEERLKNKGTRDVFEKVVDAVVGGKSSDSSEKEGESKKSHDEL